MVQVSVARGLTLNVATGARRNARRVLSRQETRSVITAHAARIFHTQKSHHNQQLNLTSSVFVVFFSHAPSTRRTPSVQSYVLRVLPSQASSVHSADAQV